jgi:Flp pilus assembly protein TadB
MSKGRARRRAAREHEAGLKAAARAAEQERRERRQARRRSARPVGGLLRPRPGRPSGSLAERRRRQNLVLAAALLAVVAVVWVVWPHWAARLGIVMLAALVFPVLRLLLFSRR